MATPAASTAGSGTSSAPRASTPTLLRIYHHLHTHASSTVADALDALSDTLDANPDDAAALRDARHRISRLFASFLHHLHTRPPNYRVSKALYQQLVSRFDEIANDINLSDDTLKAIHLAIRTSTSCRFAVSLVRRKYTELVPEDVVTPSMAAAAATTATSLVNTHIHMPRRPLKHYINHYNRLLQVASEDVKASNARLVRYRARLDARGNALPDWTVSVCRSIERAVFHVARVHIMTSPKTREKYVEDRAILALRTSVTRKLSRAGFPDKFADRAGELAQKMASDEPVVQVVADWSKKRLDRLAADQSERRQLGGVPVVEPPSVVVRDSRDHSNGSGDAWRVSRVTDASGASRSWSPREAASSRPSSSQRRSSKSNIRTRSASPSSSSSQSHRSSSDSEHVIDHLRTSQFDSNNSPASLQRRASASASASASAHESPLDDSVHGGDSFRGRLPREEPLALYHNGLGQNGSEISAEDEPPYDTPLDPYPYDFTSGRGLSQHRNMHVEDDLGDSDDTSLSQWARVEMEKERKRQEQDRIANRALRRGSRVPSSSQRSPVQYSLVQQSPAPSSPMRRVRPSSPRPPHHDGYSVERSLDESQSRGRSYGTDGSVRGASAHSASAHSDSMRIPNRLQQTSRNSINDTAYRDDFEDELDEGDGVATDETIHSDEFDEDGSENEDEHGHGEDKQYIPGRRNYDEGTTNVPPAWNYPQATPRNPSGGLQVDYPQSTQNASRRWIDYPQSAQDVSSGREDPNPYSYESGGMSARNSETRSRW